ncbi:multidrug and toxin extrusion protein 2 isoform X3 [Cervus canadensis]|uniref:multidrug and toxin extrusion protein 2 isoform X3 n=1 Tax=Cervus canadensis TaxID=1574408 RepID=UPI001C9E66CE|nr:multidrug and toxin extrusion protein 2 isoform X3 [Cervus canadensis]
MDSPQDTVPPGRRSRCPALRRLVPVGFGAEARTIFILSGPLFLFQMLNFMVYVVSTVFCGHLGTVELAAVTLSVAFVNVCGVSIGFGLSSACDTLMSQSFGSPNKKHVGVILQRGVLVLLLCCLPCWALFLNTQLILLLCRQDPAVSRLAQEYVQVYIPGLPANFLYSLQAKYLQNQGIVWPQVFSGVVGNCVNGLANYVLVSVLGQGVRGSAFANTVSQFTQAVFLLFYIVLKKLHLETWAGLLSVRDLSAQAVIYEVATVIYMIPMGLSIAVCVRVGTALGAADTVQAKRSAISGTLCTVGTSLVVGVLLSLLRNKLGHIFTNDEPLAGHAGLCHAGHRCLRHVHGPDGLEAGCRGGAETRGTAATGEYWEHGPRTQARARESGCVFSGHRQLPWRDPDDLLETRGPPGPPQDSRSSPHPTRPHQPAVSQAAGSPPGGCSGGGSGLVDSGARPEGPHCQALARQLETKRKLTAAADPKFSAGGCPEPLLKNIHGTSLVIQWLRICPSTERVSPSSPPTPPPTNPHQLGSWDPTCYAVWPENKQILSWCCVSHGGSERQLNCLLSPGLLLITAQLTGR